jgi:hypothetical protein
MRNSRHLVQYLKVEFKIARFIVMVASVMNDADALIARRRPHERCHVAQMSPRPQEAKSQLEHFEITFRLRMLYCSYLQYIWLPNTCKNLFCL